MSPSNNLFACTLALTDKITQREHLNQNKFDDVKKVWSIPTECTGVEKENQGDDQVNPIHLENSS